MKIKTDYRSTRKKGYYDGKYASVTNVLGVLDKPALTFWMQKKIFEATREGARTLGEAREAVSQESTEVMGIGTKVHKYVETYKTPDQVPVTPEIAKYIEAFHEWIIDFNPEFEKRELTVLSNEYMFGGTIDMVCIINGKRILVDLKTGKNIYPSVELQTTAYKIGYEEQEPDEIDASYVLLLEKNQAGLPTGKYRFEELDFVPGVWEAALKLFYWRESLK